MSNSHGGGTSTSSPRTSSCTTASRATLPVTKGVPQGVKTAHNTEAEAAHWHLHIPWMMNWPTTKHRIHPWSCLAHFCIEGISIRPCLTNLRGTTQTTDLLLLIFLQENYHRLYHIQWRPKLASNKGKLVDTKEKLNSDIRKVTGVRRKLPG